MSLSYDTTPNRDMAIVDDKADSWRKIGLVFVILLIVAIVGAIVMAIFFIIGGTLFGIARNTDAKYHDYPNAINYLHGQCCNITVASSTCYTSGKQQFCNLRISFPKLGYATLKNSSFGEDVQCNAEGRDIASLTSYDTYSIQNLPSNRNFVNCMTNLDETQVIYNSYYSPKYSMAIAGLVFLAIGVLTFLITFSVVSATICGSRRNGRGGLLSKMINSL